MKDYYQILGVVETATIEEIKAQYRFLAQALHPDKFASPEHKARAEERFKQINEAYQVLSDPKKRAEYDHQRKNDTSNKPEPRVSPRTMNFGTLRRNETRTAQFTVENLGAPPREVNFVSSETSWFQINHASRSFPLQVDVTVDTRGLVEGRNYSGWIEVKLDDVAARVYLSLAIGATVASRLVAPLLPVHVLPPSKILSMVIFILIIAGVFLMRTCAPAPIETPTPTSNANPGAAWYQVYFTAPKYPDKESEHRGSLDEKLTAFINAAKTSVDMAIYQLDLPNVTQALLDAKKRGATVRVVTDIDILNDEKENPSFKQLQRAGIKVVGGNPNAIMHDKFVVVDGAAVWTGSWNFTMNDTYRYNNNGILIQSPELARNYTVTFEKMFNDQLFGPARRPGGTTPRLQIGGVSVENYFAPEDKVTGKIVARLKAATKTIDFMAFSFTDDNIGDTVIARAQSGVKVRGVFETTGSETQYSELGKMKKAGLDVLQDGNAYLMHHKVFVVDDRTVIFGSFNFSQHAENENDENLLVIDDLALAQSFKSEFARVYQQAQNRRD